LGGGAAGIGAAPPGGMTDADTFEDLARRIAAQGAAAECASEALELERRAALLPRLRAEALRRASRGLRLAQRLLRPLAPAARAQAPGFGRAGRRGTLVAGYLALSQGRPAHAELMGEGLHEAAPRHPAGLRLTGQALFAQGRYRPAVRAFRGGMALDPGDGYTRALHAEALWFAGEREAALSALAALREGGGPAAELAAAIEAAFDSGAIPGRLPLDRWAAP
jgi:predicted Zn-dependent protease